MAGTLAAKLHECSLFAELDRNDVERVLATARYRLHEYAPEEIVMLRGDEYDSLAVLLSGSLAADMQSVAGKTVRVETFHAPEIIASAVLFSRRNRSPVTVSAMTRSEVLRFPRDTVLSLCHSYRSVLTALLRDAEDRVVFLAERMRLSQFASIRQKLAIYLIERAREQHGDEPVDGAEVWLEGTRRDMAELFGVTRPALSRVFAELNEQELVSTVEHDRVVLCNCDRLFELASEWE